MILYNGEPVTIADSPPVRATTAEVWEIAGELTAEYRLTELDQADPAGRYRWRVQGDTVVLQRAASAGWATSSTFLTITNTGAIYYGSTQETISAMDGDTDLVPDMQRLGADQAGGALLLGVWSTTATNAAAPLLALVKSGNAAVGSHTIVTDGEILGVIAAFGDDGVDLEAVAAAIQFEVDGTPGAGDMPGRIVFYTTTDASEAPTERLQINALGNMHLANGGGFVVGHPSFITTDKPNKFQVLGTDDLDAHMTLASFRTSSPGPGIHFVTSRNGTIGSHTKVVDSDIGGELVWYPDDGVDFNTRAAAFQAVVDGIPATGDVGMAFVWGQMAKGVAFRETLRLGADGALVLKASADSAAVADQVSIGRYEIGAGNTVLALSQETVVAVEVDETKFSHKMQCRINGATYFMMLTAT